LNILKQAKNQCETLIVGVTTDDLCFKRKKKYPIINQDQRKAIVGAIRYTDKVIDQVDMDKISAVRSLGADVVFVGSDWKGTPSWIEYEKEFAKLGCDVVYINHTDGISSTILREKIDN
jgi:glycerol-3-phosphate cytidylyltransferase